MPQYLIAHDLGTSGNKASLFTTNGELIKSHTESYNVNFFNGNHAEQNPDDWWNAVKKGTLKITEGINTKDILAISFSAQMQCCLIVDKSGNPIRPGIIWADHRAEKQAEQLEKALGYDKIYEITGHRVSATYSIEKLMWIKENEPEHYAKTHLMLNAKDYIIYKMTGEFVTDYSDASGTNALDLKNFKWSDEIINASGIDSKMLPPLHRSIDIAGTLTPNASLDLNLPTSVKVVIGGGDGPCSAVGAGCIHENELFLTFGTSAWIGGTTDNMFVDENKTLFCYCHVIPNKYMPCGTMQAAGSSYSYIKNALCKEETDAAIKENKDPYEVMNSLIESSPVGSKNLIFLPYLIGERSPRWNPNTSGSFLGIKMHHTKADYVRSVIEGVGMNLELILGAYRNYLEVNNLIITGGGAKGDVIAQILSDILKVKFDRPDNVESATSIAAAIIAGVGIGIYDDFSAIKKFLQFNDHFTPNESASETYDKLKPIFDKCYTAMTDIYPLFPV